MPEAIPPARCILGSRQVHFMVKKRSRPSGASWEQEATMPVGAFYGQEFVKKHGFFINGNGKHCRAFFYE